jgi:hypothetical protein
MASPRTVSVTVLLETAVPAEDAREVSVLADVIRSCAHAERILNGLCNGGWRMQGSRCADVDLGCLCVSFSKEFTGATPLTACENARECGVGDEHSPVFDWVPDVGDDDDGAWDRWEGEL